MYQGDDPRWWVPDGAAATAAWSLGRAVHGWPAAMREWVNVAVDSSGVHRLDDQGRTLCGRGPVEGHRLTVLTASEDIARRGCGVCDGAAPAQSALSRAGWSVCALSRTTVRPGVGGKVDLAALVGAVVDCVASGADLELLARTVEGSEEGDDVAALARWLAGRVEQVGSGVVPVCEEWEVLAPLVAALAVADTYGLDDELRVLGVSPGLRSCPRVAVLQDEWSRWLAGRTGCGAGVPDELVHRWVAPLLSVAGSQVSLKWLPNSTGRERREGEDVADWMLDEWQRAARVAAVAVVAHWCEVAELLWEVDRSACCTLVLDGSRAVADTRLFSRWPRGTSQWAVPGVAAMWLDWKWGPGQVRSWRSSDPVVDATMRWWDGGRRGLELSMVLALAQRSTS